MRWSAVFLMLVMIGAGSTLAASRQEQAAAFYEDALKRFEAGDAPGAIVQLKNALQQEPNMLAARVLLGKALLSSGEYEAAEDTFSRALALGVDRSEVVVPRAQALSMQGKHRALLETTDPKGLPKAQQVDVLLLRGQSYRALRELDAALQAFREAQALDPGNAASLLAQADLLAILGKRAEAAVLVDRALAVAPNDAAPWLVKAGVAQLSGDYDRAVAAYGKAVEVNPKSLEARIGRIALLFNLGKDAEAAADIDYLRQEFPDEPRATYLRAVYLGRRGDNAGVRETLQRLTETIDSVPKVELKAQAGYVLLIGALAHHGLGQNEKARSYLQDYLSIDPQHTGARKLLGSILLDEGDVKGAISVLEGALRAAPNDPRTLSLLASAHMARKEYRIASEYLEKALQMKGADPDIQATLGLSLLGTGQRDVAMDYFEQALAKNPGHGRAATALAAHYLRANQPKEAVAIAERLVKDDPKNVAALNLLGVAKAAAGDRTAARAAYERALAVDARFTPAQLNLAKLEVSSGNAAAAGQRLQAVLKTRPRDVQVMYELALVEIGTGGSAEALRWLEKAHALDRRNTRVTALLVEAYVRAKDPQRALTAAQETQSVLPDNLPALGALGQAYAGAGKLDAAKQTFERMSVLASFNADWQARIAVEQMRLGNYAGATAGLNKALSAQPNHLPSLAILTEVEIQKGELAKAEQRARSIVKAHQDLAIGHRLAGDIAVARNNAPEAIKAYRLAQGKEPSTDLAIRLSHAYFRNGETAKAIEHLEAWSRDHPKDLIALEALAEGHLRGGNLTAARASYEKLVAVGGEHGSALNNLANILARQGDSKALAYAERAYAVAPNEPAVLDTLGWVLLKRGQVDRGLRYLREAKLRDPQNPEIRFHLAAALTQAGRVQEARAELEPIMASNAGFEGKDEAQKLWVKLSGR